MFKPIKNKRTTHVLGAPADWDEEENGQCIGLPVCFDGEVFISWWEIDWKSRIKILFGKQIKLEVFSQSHPPVSIDIK